MMAITTSKRVMLLLALILSLQAQAWAIQPDEILTDSALEARARVIGKNLRCLVCQNQSIDDSDADLARDLRVLVRQRLTAGDSDEQVEQFVVNRYGDYVLLNPPFKAETLALWLGPIALFIVAIGTAVSFYRRRDVKPIAVKALNAGEKKRLADLMKMETTANKDSA